MKRGASEAPRLLLGVESLEGRSHATRERAIEVMARFREPESLAVTLVKALDAGAGGVLASPSRTLRRALPMLDRPVPIYARLPEPPADADLREQHWFGGTPEPDDLVGFGTRLRLRTLAAAQLLSRWRGDLIARVAPRLEIGAGTLGTRDLKGVALSPSVTDLALAGGAKRFFADYLRFARRRFGAAGLETRNLGTLLARLREWSLVPDFVVGPVNPAGVAMRPSPEETLAELERTEVPVIAVGLRASGAVSLAEGARFAREHGARGLAPDLAEMEEVAVELRALAAA